MCKIKIFGLGGLNENGKNCYVVEVDNDIFVFDAGLKYATGNLLGIDYIIPDFSYLIENKKRQIKKWNKLYKENKLNFKKLQMQYMSWLGHASHSNSYNLVRSLIQKGNFFYN